MLRKVVLADNREISRNIINLHPSGDEFLPEEFAVPYDNSERSRRIYDLLYEVVKNIAANESKDKLTVKTNT